MKSSKDYCDICDGIHDKGFHNRFVKRIKKSRQDCKEGRTYLHSCGTKRKGSNICSKSKQRLTICHDCCTKQSIRWYKIGKKDGAKK